MKRRAYLKSILGLGVLGVTSFSLFKWFDFHKPIDPKELWNKSPIIAELVELIIPATDTPGAKQARVHEYILNVLINCNPVSEQHKFLSGLEDLEHRALSNYGEKFIHCTTAQKGEIYQSVTKDGQYSNKILNKISNKLFNESFIIKLKNLTIEGYCLSQLGATQGLAYIYIPSTFEACIPLKPHQKSWATK